jgi:glutathione-regulated potassium-efflux system ancillary protein KefG
LREERLPCNPALSVRGSGVIRCAPMPKRVLILFAHPALHRSRVNRHLIEAAQSVPGVTIHDLYEMYPDSFIDVEREQKLLREHDAVVWQHPFFWYSSPAILKEWQDLVLELGFAYGEGGTALVGKRALTAITTGGPADSYDRTGFNRFTVRELLRPFEQTATLCGMEYLDPFIVHATHQLSDREITEAAERYRARIEELTR